MKTNNAYAPTLFVRSDALMEECVRMMQQNLRAAPTIKQRAKSVKAQRNLGTIKDRKREKRKEADNSSGETIMRILRMRYAIVVCLDIIFGSDVVILSFCASVRHT